MTTKSVDIISDISNIISTEYSDVPSFYDGILQKIKSLISCDYAEIYFIKDCGFEKKASTLNNDIVTLEPEIFDLIDNSVNDTFCIKDNDYFKLFSKFSLRGSVFGFLFIQLKNKPDDSQIKIIDSYIKIFSYLIKDHELSQVFRLQINALQRAVVEKKEANSFIESQNKKLIELDGIKNDFLSSVTHELRTPLNAIIGFSQALGSGIFGELNQKQSEYIKDIQASGIHLLNMINEILDFSKIEAKEVKLYYSKFEPGVIISEIINILMPLSQKKNISISLECNYNDLFYCDCQKFQQIAYNILSNAIKFTGVNGKIIIRIYSLKNKLFLEFEDNGIGIERKNHKRIFEKFVYLNNIHSPSECSTGLGLSITKEIVKMLKGKITLKSKLGYGSTFVIELPVNTGKRV